jgi:hypothetical protein
MTEIKAGDYIAFPKGTFIYSPGGGHESIRKQTKRVTEVVTDRLDVVSYLMTGSDRDRQWSADQWVSPRGRAELRGLHRQ